ncbi:MAG: hypothetical protein NTZ73_00285 [Candidatus Diapherotrites archaeon]|nr:hypothetical protein [Candidatus Diapherotrites archaeon]
MLSTEARLVLASNLKKVQATIFSQSDGQPDLDQYLAKEDKKKYLRSLGFNFGSAKQICGTTTIYTINLTKKPKQKSFEPKRGRFFIAVTEGDSFFYVLTDSNLVFLKHAVIPFITYLTYPNITRATLTSLELQNVIQNFSATLNAGVFVNKSSGKGMFGKKPQTIIKFEKNNPVSLNSVYKQAVNQDLWVHWLSLLMRGKNDSMKVNISRDGTISFPKESLGKALILFEIIGKIAESQNVLLKDKEIKPEQEMKSIILRYGEEIFSEKKHLLQLLDTIKKYKDSSYSIIHSGNPHIYMYLQDTVDKSSFSIRNLRQDSILITPQIRCGASALSRFISYLNEDFREAIETNVCD